MATKSPKLIESLRSMTAMTVATASLTLVAASSASAVTVYGFQNQYAPSNWTLTNDNADGSVNTSGAPASISLTGGNNGSVRYGTTDYTITAAGSGTVTFNWDYSTGDFLTDPVACSTLPDNFCDPFSILINGTATILLNPLRGNPQRGNYSFDVVTGDTFGFSIESGDNDFGRARVMISNFEAPAPTTTPVSVPESSSVLGLLALGGLGIGLKCRKRK